MGLMTMDRCFLIHADRGKLLTHPNQRSKTEPERDYPEQNLMKKLLILGGTGDAHQLAAAAQQISGLTVISSLAGRTQQPILPIGQVRTGGFGGEQGLINYLQDHEIDLVIDATHPFAQQISENVAMAVAALKLPFLVLERSAWQQHPGDQWLSVSNHQAAADLLPSLGQRIFLTIGRQELGFYAHLQDLWFLMRSIDPPELPAIPPGEMLLAKGPFDLNSEWELLLKYQIQAIVSKNSGGEATYAKILAARELGLPVVMIQRSKTPAGERVDNIEQVIEWLQGQLDYSTASSF
jgi:precorrin-6A/cobalt-precorrin-6A reductase